MKLHFWAALAVALRLVTADDDDGDYYGPSGANNASTPTSKDGRRTIHYVTVGKVEHEFQVSTRPAGMYPHALRTDTTQPNSIVAEVGDVRKILGKRLPRSDSRANTSVLDRNLSILPTQPFSYPVQVRIPLHTNSSCGL